MTRRATSGDIGAPPSTASRIAGGGDGFSSTAAYIEAAISNARYEPIENGKTVYAEIPGFPGVWASGSTREESGAELRKVLEGWIDLQLERHQALPEIQGTKPPEVSFA